VSMEKNQACAGPICARRFGVSLAPLVPMSGAVFLSYASQDAEAAKRICEALMIAGIEVWFDQRELRGGDAWDAKIRRQVKECALFVPSGYDRGHIRRQFGDQGKIQRPDIGRDRLVWRQ